MTNDILSLIFLSEGIKLDDTNLNDELSKFLDGFKLIYSHFTEALKKYGVEYRIDKFIETIWKYVPYNLFNEAKLFQDFRSKIKSSSHWSDAKLNDPLTWTDDEIVELRNIYKTFSTYSINSNTM